MKRVYFFVSLILMSFLAIAQEEAEKKDPIVKFSGHIRFESFFDSHESTTSRDGDIYLYPKPAVENADGDDVAAYGQLNMISAQSRLRAKISGPNAFGAKVSGMAEVDFLGKTGGFEQTPRIRHMFMNLKWKTSALTLGQTWHPVFVTECFPQVLGMGAALPINPLSRAPQIKLTLDLSEEIKLVGAAISHLDMKVAGLPVAQQNAVIPDLHGQLKYVSGSLATGIVGGAKFLRPRILTNNGEITKTLATSFDVALFAKIKANDLTLKGYFIYGQNLSNYVMIGGVGAADLNDDFEYSNIVGMSTWAELIYKINNVGIGVFGGYAANLGHSGDNYYSLGLARGENIQNLIRVSPRITLTSGKVMFGLEYLLAGATYGALEADEYKFDSTDDMVINHRIHLSAKYTF